MLRFHWEWLPTPAVPVQSHALTWSRFEIRTGPIRATHVEDLRSTSVRDAIYIPLMPLAEWFAKHWWFLLGETAPSGERRGAREEPALRRWYARHNLLAAREGDPLPDLTLSVADDDLALLQLVPDPADVDRRYPVRFTERAIVRVELRAVRDELTRFLNAVVDRLEGCRDADAMELKERWGSIRGMTGEDKLLRERAAALGLDGDDPDSVPDDFAEALTQGLAGIPLGLANDLLAGPTDLPGLRERLADVQAARSSRVDEEDTGPLASARQSVVTLQDPFAPAFRIGWKMAAEFRARVLSVNSTCGAAVLDGAIDQTEVTHVVAAQVFRDEFVRGWVGADAKGRAQVVLPETSLPTQRFLRARSIALALLGRRERLLTNAQTQSQSVSRAFATELLAPAEMVRQLLQNRVATADVIGEIATQLQVRDQVIIHQVENHGMAQLAD